MMRLFPMFFLFIRWGWYSWIACCKVYMMTRVNTNPASYWRKRFLTNLVGLKQKCDKMKQYDANDSWQIDCSKRIDLIFLAHSMQAQSFQNRYFLLAIEPFDGAEKTFLGVPGWLQPGLFDIVDSSQLSEWWWHKRNRLGLKMSHLES